MSYGLITGGGATGRYTISMDYGQATKTAILAALSVAQGKLNIKLAQQQVIVYQKDAQEQTALDNLVIAQQQVMDSMAEEGEPNSAALEFYTHELEKYRQLKVTNMPARQALATIKGQLAECLREIARYNEAVVTETKQAWCCDLTENASGYVGLVDIPGETTLQLIAPGGRAWLQGDGAISIERKAANLARLNAQLAPRVIELGALDTAIASTTAEQVTLKAEVKAAQNAYIATPSKQNQEILAKATQKLTDSQRSLAVLQLSRVSVQKAITSLGNQINYWNAKTASASPNYGDGVMTAREIMSPEQAYFNAAILPGWQKWMPTYRWGYASDIDYEANTMTVSLDPTTSSAQSLNVNQEDTLRRVPVVYMTCNAGAFKNDDRVVVQFSSLTWENPKVIGFLDNPKACPYWPTITVAVTWSSVEGSMGSIGIGDPIHTDCGLLMSASATASTAPPAVHTLAIATPTWNQALVDIVAPGATFASSMGSETLQSFNSSGYKFTSTTSAGFRFPSPGSEWVFCGYQLGTENVLPNGYIQVRSLSHTNVTGPWGAWTGYGTGCNTVGYLYIIGKYLIGSPQSYTQWNFTWQPSIVSTQISAQSLVDYLTSIGKLPVIEVTQNGRTRRYKTVTADSPLSQDQDNMSWTISFNV